MEAAVRSVSIGVSRPCPPMVGRLATLPASLVGAIAGAAVTGPELGVVDPAETGEARLEVVRVTV